MPLSNVFSLFLVLLPETLKDRKGIYSDESTGLEWYREGRVSRELLCLWSPKPCQE